MSTPADARALFEPDVVYLDTASAGLPSRGTLEAVHAVMDRWRSGELQAPDTDDTIAACRAAFAALVGVAADEVAIGSQASAMIAPVAAAVPDGGEVLCAAGDFTSVVFPFLAQARRGVRVREVPLADLAGAVGPQTDLVAVSAVQSADGAVADLEALAGVAAAGRTEVLIDATQAAGWLPLDATRFTYTVTGGYKWLMAPRGTAFLTVGAARAEQLPHDQAGWYAGEDRWDSLYGGPLRLAHGARGLDVSPAWFSWVGQLPALRLLADVGVAATHAHDVALANAFRAGVGLPPATSAIVSLPVAPTAAAALAEHGVAAAMRAGRLRLSFHLYNDTTDVDAVVAAIADHAQHG
jgi:selenocysteine lyase/cysteine desulfurase